MKPKMAPIGLLCLLLIGLSYAAPLEVEADSTKLENLRTAKLPPLISENSELKPVLIQESSSVSPISITEPKPSEEKLLVYETKTKVEESSQNDAKQEPSSQPKEQSASSTDASKPASSEKDINVLLATKNDSENDLTSSGATNNQGQAIEVNKSLPSGDPLQVPVDTVKAEGTNGFHYYGVGSDPLSKEHQAESSSRPTSNTNELITEKLATTTESNTEAELELEEEHQPSKPALEVQPSSSEAPAQSSTGKPEAEKPALSSTNKTELQDKENQNPLKGQSEPNETSSKPEVNDQTTVVSVEPKKVGEASNEGKKMEPAVDKVVPSETNKQSEPTRPTEEPSSKPNNESSPPTESAIGTKPASANVPSILETAATAVGAAAGSAFGSAVGTALASNPDPFSANKPKESKPLDEPKILVAPPSTTSRPNSPSTTRKSATDRWDRWGPSTHIPPSSSGGSTRRRPILPSFRRRNRPHSSGYPTSNRDDAAFSDSSDSENRPFGSPSGMSPRGEPIPSGNRDNQSGSRGHKLGGRRRNHHHHDPNPSWRRKSSSRHDWQPERPFGFGQQGFMRPLFDSAGFGLFNTPSSSSAHNFDFLNPFASPSWNYGAEDEPSTYQGGRLRPPFRPDGRRPIGGGRPPIGGGIYDDYGHDDCHGAGHEHENGYGQGGGGGYGNGYGNVNGNGYGNVNGNDEYHEDGYRRRPSYRPEFERASSTSRPASSSRPRSQSSSSRDLDEQPSYERHFVLPSGSSRSSWSPRSPSLLSPFDSLFSSLDDDLLGLRSSMRPSQLPFFDTILSSPKISTVRHPEPMVEPKAAPAAPAASAASAPSAPSTASAPVTPTVASSVPEVAKESNGTSV